MWCVSARSTVGSRPTKAMRPCLYKTNKNKNYFEAGPGPGPATG